MEFKSFEDFRDQFIEDVKQKLDEQGTDVSIKGNTVTKLNESYEAITVTPEGSNIGVNMNIDNMYIAITREGATYDEVVDRAVVICGGKMNEDVKEDISIAKRAKVIPTTLEGILECQ